MNNRDHYKLKQEDIMMYCNNKCPSCGIILDYRKGGNVQIDRIIPGDKGDGYDPNNIGIICKDCNTMKIDKTIDIINKDIGERLWLIHAQSLQIPDNLKRMIGIYKYLTDRISFQVDEWFSQYTTNKNKMFKKRGNWYIRINDGNTYCIGDEILVSKNSGDEVMVIAMIWDNICVPDTHTVPYICQECGNILHYRIKRKTKKKHIKERESFVCKVCKKQTDVSIIVET